MVFMEQAHLMRAQICVDLGDSYQNGDFNGKTYGKMMGTFWEYYDKPVETWENEGKMMINQWLEYVFC